MRKYYTRPCNFYYGNYARKLIEKKKAFSLSGRSNIAFDQVEVFHRNKKKIVKSKFYSIKKLKQLDKETLQIVKKDLKNITHERKSILGLKFDEPMIMGALNITPDSFSDGGLFFEEAKAYEQVKLMIDSGATIIDIGGESTRPGSKTVDEKEEWKRVEKTIIKFKQNYPKVPLSLDTRKSYVMSKGIQNGVDIINDVSGLNFDNKSDSNLLFWFYECALLTHLGFKPDLGPIKSWGLELSGKRIVVNQLMQTSIPGIYAAGDLVSYPGKLDLIATGYGEAAIAVNNAVNYLDPGARVNPGHSTNLSIFKDK